MLLKEKLFIQALRAAKAKSCYVSKEVDFSDHNPRGFIYVDCEDKYIDALYEVMIMSYDTVRKYNNIYLTITNKEMMPSNFDFSKEVPIGPVESEFRKKIKELGVKRCKVEYCFDFEEEEPCGNIFISNIPGDDYIKLMTLFTKDQSGIPSESQHFCICTDDLHSFTENYEVT